MYAIVTVSTHSSSHPIACLKCHIAVSHATVLIFTNQETFLKRIFLWISTYQLQVAEHQNKKVISVIDSKMSKKKSYYNGFLIRITKPYQPVFIKINIPEKKFNDA